jgi:ABC-type nitrate/sulfonate/bicarbonate transport system substrate-binding protein
MTMRLALPDLVSNSYFPAVAAVELGCFRDEGLQMEIELHFPVTSAMQELAAGHFDFVAGAAHAVLTAFPGWHGAELLAALAQHMYWFLIVRADLGLRRGDLSGLEGVRIGAAPGVDIGLHGLLRAAGVDVEKQRIHIAPVPGTGSSSVSFGVSAARALAQGSIDGFWANGMGAEVALREGTGTLLLDVRRGDGPPGARGFTFPALVATDSLIARSPAVAEAAVRAIVRAQSRLKADPELATGIGRKLFPPMEAELIAELIRRDLPYYDPTITPETVERLNSFAMDTGLLDRPVPYEQVVATQFSPLWGGGAEA